MADRRVERISSGKAAALCGFTPKTIRRLAEEGTIPGAARLGNQWRFDEKKLLGWIRRQEAEACRPKGATISSNGMGSGTRASRFAVATCDEAYEQLLRQKPKSDWLSC